MEINGLTATLNQFIGVFNGGYAKLAPYAVGILATLIAIDVALAGAFTALGKHNAASLLEKVLFLGGWTYVTTRFQELAKAFVNSLISAGLIAGGKPADYGLLLDPSRIAGYGLKATEPILALAEKSGIMDGGDMIVYWGCYGLLMLCFVLMAAQVFLCVLEYYIRLTLSVILVPFGVWAPTRFIGEKAIGAIVSSGIKLMVLALVLAVGEQVLAANIRFSGDEITFNQLWSAVLITLTIALFTWQAPSIAVGLLSGSPAMSAAGAAQAAVTGATFAAAGAGAALAPVRAAVSGVRAIGGDGGGNGGESLGQGGARPAAWGRASRPVLVALPAPALSPLRNSGAEPPKWAASARQSLGGPGSSSPA